MAMRLSGLMSGMDTESIVQQLVEARKEKVTKAVKAQKTIQYQQEAWKSLNTQILNLYNKSLSNLRFESSFIKKTTKVSNSSVVSVITGENAMNSVQSLKVTDLAKTTYWTSGKITATDGAELSGNTKLSELGFDPGENGNITIEVDGKTSHISVTKDTTISSFVNSLKSAGVNANFDANNGRIFIASTESGEAHNFTIKASNVGGIEALNALKLNDGTSEISPANQTASINSRVQSRLGKLDSYAQTLANRDEINALAQKYATEINAQLSLSASNKLQSIGSDFDYTKLDDQEKAELKTAIKNAIVKADVDEGVTDDSPIVKDLGGWLEGWDDVESGLAGIEEAEKYEDYIEIKNGNAVWTDDAEAEIRSDVEAEVQAVLANRTTKNVENIQEGADAKIILNGVEYYSSRNTFEINGLTLTVNATTGDNEEVTLTTEDDTDGIYDMVKNFITEYSTLINQMDKLYNADSAKGYDPLTDEEKEAMSDSQIEEWEKKIKDSILRKDSTLGTFADTLKRIMMEGVEVNGKKMYLSNFGINTLNYFTSAENEKYAYHIDGDPDDSNTSGNPDKLKSMIANDPDTVVSFFTQLAKNLYEEMFEMMKSKEGYSSAMTAYDDKKMQSDYDDYTVKIKELEDKLADYEDKWYAKFAAMETALAKMQNNASAVTALLGG